MIFSEFSTRSEEYPLPDNLREGIICLKGRGAGRKAVMEYIPAKHLLHRSRSAGWFGTDHTMNIYRGCCHGCLYCDSRSDCYRIGDFDTVRAKADAMRILRNDLARKVRPAFISMGAMSDPYNPYEKKLQLTRHALELIDAYGCGVAIATKSNLIVRDIDILTSIQRHSPVICKLTITTADDALAAKLEPNAPSPGARLAALKELGGAGLFAGVLLMPVLPFLEDGSEGVLAVVEAADRAGARFIYSAFGVTLRQGQREYFLDGLERAFPNQGLKERYLRQYGDRYQCTSPKARELWKVFTQACRERGILYDMRSIRRAAALGYGDRQLTFFD